MRTTVRILLAGLSLVSLLHAQQDRSAMMGTVTDPSGAAVPGANVTITNTATNVPFQTRTDGAGFYAAPALTPGSYTLTVKQQGFKEATRAGILLSVDQRAQVNLTLEVGAMTEKVEVVGEAPLVDTASATEGKVIENRRINDLPMNGRTAFGLAILTPNVKSGMGPTDAGFDDRGRNVVQISINGSPNGTNTFIIDGGNDVNSYYNDLSAVPTVEAVEEFKVQSGSMSAEFGNTLGGVVNVVTKSGTNQPHGSLYEFLRNDKLDARNTFAVSKYPLRYNQFGGALGGPVYIPHVYDGRNRTFFFFNYETYLYRYASSATDTFPIAEQRTGDFSHLFTSTGTLIPIYDPLTTVANPSGSGYVRNQFPGNVIPASRLDPVSVNIMKYYPMPNRAPTNIYTNSNNFYYTPANGYDMRQETARIDHHFSDKNTLFGRYMVFGHYQKLPVGGIIPCDVFCGYTSNMINHNVVLGDTHVISPKLLNELRISLARHTLPFIQASWDKGWPQTLGLPASVPPWTFPGIESGLNGFTGDRPNGGRASLDTQFLDMISAVRGRHTIKTGVEYRIKKGANLQAVYPSGDYSFASGLTSNPQSPTGTGATLATFLLGDVSSASFTTHTGELEKGFSLSFFVQDDWKATRRLTLNLGLRYDYQQPPYEANGGSSNFNPFAINPDNGLPGRTGYAGIDYGNAYGMPDKHNFGPRFGFAYDLLGNGRTVLRGGYGVYYENIFSTQFFGSTAGFATTTTSYVAPNGNSNYPAMMLKDGLPFPVTQPLGSKLGPSAFVTGSASWSQSNQRVPMSQQWNFSAQHQIAGGWLVEAAYTANHGTRLVSGSYNFNQLDPQYYAQLGLALQNSVPNPYVGKVAGTYGGATITRSQSLVPYPYIGSISVNQPHQGSSSYNAGIFSVEKRLSRGFSFMGNYTWSKLISDSVAIPLNWYGEQTLITGYQNGKYNRRAERSLDPTDVAQRLVFSGIYELPFGAGRHWSSVRPVNAVLGGWQVNTIITFQGGLPLNITGANNNLANRPNSTGKSAKLQSPTQYEWFDTTAFVNPPTYTYGNVGRTLPDVRTPGAENMDLSLIKDTRIRERVRLQFRAEAFNVLNHVNLSAPSTGFSPGANGYNASATFGTITSARDPRHGQLALKLIF